MFENVKVFVEANKEAIIKNAVIVTGAVIGVVLATVLLKTGDLANAAEDAASEIIEPTAE